jgi:hypothetical protein
LSGGSRTEFIPFRAHDERNEFRSARKMNGMNSVLLQGVSDMIDQKNEKRPPGTCVPWDEKRKEIPKINGDEALVKRIWEDVDALGYVYIWQVLLSF